MIKVSNYQLCRKKEMSVVGTYVAVLTNPSLSTEDIQLI